MKHILLLLLFLISIAGFSQTIGTPQLKDGAVTEPKLAPNALRPIDGGVLSNYELVFDEVQKKYTLLVSSDIALTIAASGHTAYSRIYIVASGDGSHALTFPSNWILDTSGALTYNPGSINKIQLDYDGTFVVYKIIQTIPVIIPILTEAVVVGGTDDVTLTFDNTVTITTAGWTCTASGGAVTVSSVVSGSGTTVVVFDLSRNITAGEDMTISYDPTTGNTLSSTLNEIALISNHFVDTGDPPAVDFCDITVCASGCDYTTGQAASDAAVAGQTVCFGAGTYRETIVGKTGVTYRNIPGETAIISGLTDAGSSGWTVHSGNIYKKTITLPVSNNMSTGDLTSTTTIMANQVFKSGVMVHLARWPKISTSADLMDRTKTRFYSSTQGLTSSQVTDSGLPSTGNLSGAHISIAGWFMTQTRQITARTGNVITYPAVTADLHFVKWYYITNHIDLLTQANEWFYGSGILYVWQTGGGSPTGIEYKSRNWGFDLRGKDNVTITGLTFIGCEPMTGDVNTDGCVIDNIRATYTNHAFTQIDPDNIYRSPKMHGMKIMGNNNIIRNSEFQYCASNLIWAGPNSLVTNNLASDISYEGNYGAFVIPSAGAGGQQITYNTVSRVGRSAVDFGYDGAGGSGSHLNMDIGYNIFHTYLMLNHDGGAVYGARGVNLTGTNVHHNWIYDCWVADHWNDAGSNAAQNPNNAIAPQQDWYGVHPGIYYDQYAGPSTNHHNVLWDQSTSDVFIQPGLGRVTRWYNNTFASDMPRTKWTYASWITPSTCIMRNNIAVGYINMVHGQQIGDLRNNLLTTENSNQPAGNLNVINNSPLFVGTVVGSTTGLNMRIQSGSPARNIGVHIPGITDGYEGAAPDAGAYEFGDDWEPGYVEVVDGADYIIDNEDMTYTGVGWVHTSGQAYNPPPTFSQSYSPTSAAYVEASVTGTEFRLYAERRFNHGIVEVKINGVRQDCDPGTGGTQDCDLYVVGSTNNATLIGTWSITPGAARTVRVTKVGGNASCTDGCNINIDYLEVTP